MGRERGGGGGWRELGARHAAVVPSRWTQRCRCRGSLTLATPELAGTLPPNSSGRPLLLFPSSTLHPRKNLPAGPLPDPWPALLCRLDPSAENGRSTGRPGPVLGGRMRHPVPFWPAPEVEQGPTVPLPQGYGLSGWHHGERPASPSTRPVASSTERLAVRPSSCPGMAVCLPRGGARERDWAVSTP